LGLDDEFFFAKRQVATVLDNGFSAFYGTALSKKK